MLAHKLKDLMGPLLDLPSIDQTEVKFNGRSRLYIGNLTNDATEEEINNLFSGFGECSELFLNKEKNFGFIKMVSIILRIKNKKCCLNVLIPNVWSSLIFNRITE